MYNFFKDRFSFSSLKNQESGCKDNSFFLSGKMFLNLFSKKVFLLKTLQKQPVKCTGKKDNKDKGKIIKQQNFLILFLLIVLNPDFSVYPNDKNGARLFSSQATCQLRPAVSSLGKRVQKYGIYQYDPNHNNYFFKKK